MLPELYAARRGENSLDLTAKRCRGIIRRPDLERSGKT
jgi:hypothetical protein